MKLKLARATEKEIDDLWQFLNELTSLNNNIQMEHLGSIDWDEYEILSDFDHESYDTFMCDVVEYLSGLRHDKILFNLTTLMENCADLKSDVLDFNKEIKEGMELYENRKEEIN